MKHLYGLCLVLGLVLVGCPSDPPPPTHSAHLSSRVELAAGEVWMTSGKTTARVMTGTMVEQGAAIETHKGARALVRLHNGAGVFLRDKTRIQVNDDGILLKGGELWADVPEDEKELAHFDLGNVQVTAAGAGLDIWRSGNKARVYVSRGLAVVEAPGGRVEVAAGEQAVVDGKKPKLSPVAFFHDWTGGMADRPLQAGVSGSASGKIYGIDRSSPGSSPKELQIVSQQVQTIIRDGVAYTTVDQTFFNTASTPVEGWYWFTLPEGASVVRFAWEVNGQMVDGNVVERKQAAQAYEAAVQREIDPALLEWINERTYRARIFPVPATGNKRIVLGYAQLLPMSDGAYRYVYPMVGEKPVQIQEFSLRVNLGDAGSDYEISTLQDAKVERDKKNVSMRRSGFVPHSDFLLELRPKQKKKPLRVMRYRSGANEADYMMLRYSPEVDWKKIKDVPGDVVVVLDTSAGGDSAEHQIRIQTAEAILRALSDNDRFAVMSTDLTPQVLYPAKGMSRATEPNLNAAVEKMTQINPAGATDLGEMFSAALALVHDATQPAIVYVGDGQATSGETTSDALAERLRRTMGNSKARLFTIAVGADANYNLLHRLAAVGGGKMFRIDLPEQIVQESLRFAGQLKTPTITELQIDMGAGLDQVFTSRQGKLSEGEEVVLLARTHHQLPGSVTIRGSLAGKSFSQKYKVKTESGDAFAHIPSLWARMYLERLMGRGLVKNRGKIISLGLHYGLMTPFTSFLVLDKPVIQQTPEYMNPFRAWTINQNDTQQKIGAKEALSIPLFGFGCSEYKASEKAERLNQDQHQQMAAPLQAVKEENKVANSSSSAVPIDASEAPRATPPVSSDMARPSAVHETMKTGEMARRSPKRARTSPLDGLLAGGSARPSSARGSRGGKPRQGMSKDKSANMGSDGDDIGAENREEPPTQVAQNNKSKSFNLAICSDAASRPLSVRRVLWERRLQRAHAPADMKRIYEEAGERCELSNYRHRKVLLDLIAAKVNDASQVRQLLSAFSKYPAAQVHLRRWISRAFLNADITMGRYFGTTVNWRAVKIGLAALKTPALRLEEIRRVVQDHPHGVQGRMLLISILVENAQFDAARREAERLHHNQEATPEVLITLCDLQAQSGDDNAARRTCSELVEFSAQSAVARRKLGDLFLRHGWYSDAYRQFASLVEASPDDPLAALRLSIAAAGMGKIDEALRIARKVATGDGEPGLGDPRRWAMALSVARISVMLIEAQKKGDKKLVAALERQMKRTGLFTGKKVVELLMWEDLDISVDIAFTLEGRAVEANNSILGAAVGILLFEMDWDTSKKVEFGVSPSAPHPMRKLTATRIQIRFNGTEFKIDTQQIDVKQDVAESLLLAGGGTP